MKAAFQKDEAFLLDVQRVLSAGGRAIWWLGQSGFLVIQRGRAIVLDPYLSDSLTRKYAGTDKPHVRVTERVVDPAALGALGCIDLITSSHNHTDHLDPETLVPLLDDNPKAHLAVPAANREFALERLPNSKSVALIELDRETTVEQSGFRVTGIAAAHPTQERDAAGHCKFLGYVIEWNGLTLYHSGDTLWHEPAISALRHFRIDIALLPINGDLPERRVAGNLDGPEAARFGRAIGARLVVPCHYGMFEFNTAAPAGFAAECKRVKQRFRILENGEKLPVLSVGQD
jgi:L-ascorbate metabolism protein UlaG (beta-lactamase superfamily)